MVKVVLGNVHSQIVGYLPDIVQEDLDKTLSYRLTTARFMPRFKRKEWDGVFRLYRRNRGQTFYTGLLSYVREILEAHNVEHVKIDNRCRPEINLPSLQFIPPPNFETRQYQDFTIQRALKFTRGILGVSTGGGKTNIVARLISEIKTYPFMFYVLTKDLMEQGRDVLSTCLNEPIGKIGDGECDIQKINVCTIQTAVQAINMGNKNFKIEDYKFDEEDVWDEKAIESEEKAERIRTLIRSAKGVYMDECVSGDTEVITERGKTRIDKISKNKCRFVQTHDGNNIVFKPIRKLWDKGRCLTMEIETIMGGKIRCTMDHLFLTQRGWVEARELKVTDNLFIVNAVAGKKCGSQISGDHKNIFSDTKLDQNQKNSGSWTTSNTSANCQNASVDAGTLYFRDTSLLKSLLSREERDQDVLSIYLGMISNPYMQNTTLSQPPKKEGLFSGLVLETRQLDCRTIDQRILDCPLHMEFVKKNGQSTKLSSCEDLELNIGKKNVTGLAKSLLSSIPHVCHFLRRSPIFFARMGKRQFLMKSLKNLVQSELLGGFVTTAQIAWDAFQYIRRDGQKRKTRSFRGGSLKRGSIVRFKKPQKETRFFSTSDLVPMDQKNCEVMFGSSCQNLWRTNWTAIKNIRRDGIKTRVYDIEVDETHCFFANGLLVHNCHHTGATTVRDVMVASENAYWRYGGSVGPESYVEMRGGCFEKGFVGPIERAFEIASRTLKIYTWKDFQVIDLCGVESRGWSESGFAWKKCLRILRHVGKPCLDLRAQGVNLLITPDHSVYHAKNTGLVKYGHQSKRVRQEPQIECVSSEILNKGDVLMGDDGGSFESNSHSEIDMVDFCLKHMKNYKVSVHCSPEKIDRSNLRHIANPKIIYNWRTRGGIPIDLFVKINNPPPIKYLKIEGSNSHIYPKVNLEDWAYILGFYLGDGWVSSEKYLGFSVGINQSEYIYEKLKSLRGVKCGIQQRKMPGKSVEFRVNNRFVVEVLLSIFGSIKCYEKFIPGEWIVGWSKTSREQFLAGLMDSDGCVYNGKCDRVRNSYCTTSPMMSKGLCSLLRSLGLWGSVDIRKPRIGGIVNGRQIVGRRCSYIVRWSERREGFNRSGKHNYRFIHDNSKFVELPVNGISEGVTPEWIYDLEMNGHPSFVADGILVHNSATPYREDGASIMIQAMFGSKIVDISASYLIEQGYLITPHIFIEDFDHGSVKYHSYRKVYSECISNCNKFNDHVAEAARHLVNQGLSTLVLVQYYLQGDYLKEIIPGSVFVSGRLTSKKRKQYIQDLRDRKIMCMIATSLADEGLDVPSLDAAILAGGGASATRVTQRIGRTIRKNKLNPKDRSIVIIYNHKGAKFLEGHTKKIVRLLKKEPKFIIKESKGPDFICQEIDTTLGLKSHSSKLFDGEVV